MSRAIKLQKSGAEFVLPPEVIGRSDVSHLLLEIEKVDYDLEAQTIKNPDKAVVLPSLTRSLTNMLAGNKLSVESPEHRKTLLENLRKIKEHAPMVQITFAVDPDPDALAQLVDWMRTHLHPTALVTVGMQPAIIGGCIVRTPDHIYDFSLKKQFKQQVSELASAINAIAARSA